MKECWNADPDTRPDFTQLAVTFSDMLHTSVKEVSTHQHSRDKYVAKVAQNEAKLFSPEMSTLLPYVSTNNAPKSNLSIFPI